MFIFNVYKKFISIVLCCYKKWSNVLWYFDGNFAVIVCTCLFSRQKLCVILSVVPFKLVNIANWFSFLNMSFSGGLKIFYGSILVSSLRSKRWSTGAIRPHFQMQLLLEICPLFNRNYIQPQIFNRKYINIEAIQIRSSCGIYKTN